MINSNKIKRIIIITKLFFDICLKSDAFRLKFKKIKKREKILPSRLAR